MRLVTTPAGNTGRAVLKTVQSVGVPVRAFVCDPAKLDTPPKDMVQGDLRDPEALRRALDGVSCAFFCVTQSENPDNLVEYFNSFARPFAEAARTGGLRRLVTISGGEDGDHNAGPGIALRSNEDILNGTGAAVRHVRCGYFMENLLWQVQPLACAGFFKLPVAPGVPLAFVSADDIGRAAGGLMLRDDWIGISSVEAYGPGNITCEHAAEILTDVLGKPIRYVQAEARAWANELMGYGLSRATTDALVAMFAAIENGHDMGRKPDTPVDCPTGLHEWAALKLAPAVKRVMS